MKKKEDSSSALRYRMTHAELMDVLRGWKVRREVPAGEGLLLVHLGEQLPLHELRFLKDTGDETEDKQV